MVQSQRDGSSIVTAPDGGSIMVVAAHPDDIECWCAGTLALAIDAGAAIRLLLATSGDKGSGDPAADAAVIATQREEEVREASIRLGLTEVVFLHHLDGEVENTRLFRGELVRWIRRWRPDALFTHDPEQPLPPYLSHRDHRMTGRAALDAVYPLARDPLSFPEHLGDDLAPHAVAEVWLFASAVADDYVDIAKSIDRKIAARLAHVSQTSDPVVLAVSWRQRAGDTGAEVGLPLAEAFKVLHLQP